jgi:hypothetical protein
MQAYESVSRVYVVINGIELECHMDLVNSNGHVPCLILGGDLQGYELLLHCDSIKALLEDA